MQSNLERHRQDLKKLVKKGVLLQIAMFLECYPDHKDKLLEEYSDKIDGKLPNIFHEYQAWYSESKALIQQILPGRLADFVQYYEKPKSRKTISPESYRIEDFLQRLRADIHGQVAGMSDAIPHLEQQRAILEAASARFESSLFNIHQLVQADLLNSELATATELLKKGFIRPSGVIAGVVLERHLSEVTKKHNIKIRKKDPSIYDFNEQLKKNDVYDTPTWRNIQFLADIRNLCSHNKTEEPTKEQVKDLIKSVDKIIKTLF